MAWRSASALTDGELAVGVELQEGLNPAENGGIRELRDDHRE
jgi:hypothetical protein